MNLLGGLAILPLMRSSRKLGHLVTIAPAVAGWTSIIFATNFLVSIGQGLGANDSLNKYKFSYGNGLNVIIKLLILPCTVIRANKGI